MTEYENFGKITIFAIAFVGIIAFLMLAGNVVSADCENLVEIPDFPVNAVFAHWGSESYWDTTISGIGGPEEGYYVWDDTWVGWCVDEYDYIYPGTNYVVNLNSTYDPDMPWPDPDWDMVNYLINHKNSSASIQDIQDAIWYFVDGGNIPATLYGQSMVNDALANGEGFIPNKGQIVAVLIDAGSGVQKTFIEVPIPCTICFVQPLNGVDGDVSGWSTDESMVVLPSSHWDLLDGTADVNGYINSPGILTHRGTRGLGIHGHEDDEIDSFDRPERIEVTFDSPHILDRVEVRSLFGNEGPGGVCPEEGDVDLYLFGEFIMNYHLVGVENLGTGPGKVIFPIPSILVDKVVFYVNQTESYASWSEFSVAQLCTGAAVDIEKQVWNWTSSSWEDEIRTPVGTDLKFRIILTNNGEVNLTNLAVTDVLSEQLEYRYNANYSEYYVSPDLHQVIWHLASLEKGESMEIQYRAETVQKCYGSNFVNVTTAESAYDEDTVDVKVPAEGQPLMDIGKQVWDEISGQWKDSVTCVLGSQLKFRVFLNSTAFTISEDVNIVDSLPPYLKYSNDASHSPEYYSSNLIKWHFDEISPGETQEIIYHAEALQEGREDTIVYVTTSESYYDEDSLLVKVVDYPDVEILYPRGGEILSETVIVEWAATDAHDPVLDIYLYYSVDNGVTWNRLSHIFDNNEYNWDTTELSDGYYILKVESEDSDHLLAVDTSGLFTIENNEAPTYPPVKPVRPSGSANGNPGTIETYSSSTTDPDGDQVFYFWDWGDGTSSGWLGPYKSGEICEASHTWDEKGTYNIKVKAKDYSDKESDWSDPLPITMPKNKSINPFLLFLEKLIERFPILEQILQPVYDKLSSFY